MYGFWILHKKLVLGETFAIIRISTNISLDISPRILNFQFIA